MNGGTAEAWLITFTQSLRSALPSGQYIITHAPVAPWFAPIYTAGAYTKVNSEVGDLIDWVSSDTVSYALNHCLTSVLVQHPILQPFVHLSPRREPAADGR